MRKPILPEEITAITIQFLVTGETFHSLMYHSWLHRVIVGKFFHEVCKTIYHCLKNEYLNILSTTEE